MGAEGCYRRIVVVLSVVVALALGACGRSNVTDGQSLRSNSAGSPRMVPKCSGRGAPEFGNEPLCADSGLRVGTTLTFPNWRGFVYPYDDFGIDEMVALFGTDAICASYDAGICDERADAALRRDELNAMISAGRCEGMTTLAARLHVDASLPEEVGGVASAAELNPRIRGVVDVVDYWWATQFNEVVIERTAEVRDLGLGALVGLLIDAIKGQLGFTMGIYSQGSGHSVLPVAVTAPADDRFNVWVWDSNSPRVLAPLLIDIDSGTWEFRSDSDRSGSGESVWRGGTGTIDLTPMTARDTRPKADFSGAGRGKIRVSAVSVGRGTTEMMVTGADGRRAGIVNGVVVSEIPDAVVQLHRDGDGDGLTVLIPAEVQSFTIASSTTTPGNDGGALITISEPRGGVRQVRTAPKGNGGSVSLVASVDVAARSLSIEPGLGTEALVRLGRDRLLVEVPVESGDLFEARSVAEASSETRVVLTRDGEPILDELVRASNTKSERITFDPVKREKKILPVAPKTLGGDGLRVIASTTSTTGVASESSTTVMPSPSTMNEPTLPAPTSTSALAVSSSTDPVVQTVAEAPTTTLTKTGSTTSTSVKQVTPTFFKWPVQSTIGLKIPVPTSTTLKLRLPTTTTFAKSSTTTSTLKK